MPFTLFSHPLSSYCWKVLIALYEAEADFKAVMVNLGDAGDRAEYLKMSPFGKIPTLRNEATGEVVLETSLIIEHLAMTLPRAASLLPADRKAAFGVRARDRFFDLYVNTPMGKIVTDRLRPAGKNDPFGVEAARNDLRTAYGVIERDLSDRRTWAAGETFTMADCAAAPALFYAAKTEPLGDRPNTAAYLQRLLARPSVARTVREAEPYFSMVPK